MTARRRPSMRTRMKAEDVSCWVEHNQQPFSPSDEPRVRFEAPAPVSARSDDSDAESVESLTERPVYKDGGYGWLVVLASFLMHAVCDGASFCFGIVFVKIQEHFQCGRFVSMITASMFLSLPLIMSPVAGIVSDILGCRMSIIIGASICTVSCIIAMFCSHIFFFMISFGLGCGVGMSFIYNAAIVIVTYYFEKRRGLATSFAVSGTGVGTVIYPILLNLSMIYLASFVSDIRIILIFFAVMYFVIAVIGFFIKDVEWESDKTDFKLRKFQKYIAKMDDEKENNTNPTDAFMRHAISLPNLNILNNHSGSIQSICDAAKAERKSDKPTRSKSVALFDNKHQMSSIPEYSMLNTNLANLEHLDLELANSPCTTVRAQRRRVISKVSMSVDQINELEDEAFHINLFQSSTESESDDESSSDDSEMSNDGDSSSSELSEKNLDEPTTKLINKNLENVAFRATSSVPNSARMNRNSVAAGTSNMFGGRVIASNAIQSRHATNLIAMGKIPSAPMLVARKNRKSMIGKPIQGFYKKWLETEKPIYQEVIHCRAYIYLALSVLCLYFILDVPYVCFYEYSIDTLKMEESEANYIYYSIGISNFISVLLFGTLADWTRKHITTIYASSMVGVGITIMFSTRINSLVELVIVGVCFGVTITSNYVLQSILVTICFEDVNLFQVAYSLIAMIEGVASLIGPPIFALVREATGGYTVVFFISGIFALASGFFGFMFSYEMNKRNTGDKDSIESGKPTELTNGNNRQTSTGSGAEQETLLDV
ncbi:MFS domain-containing protein [Caenorhabditis elegans]|uniref:MFS domain-containing protein n=1 Tax=Caenorhabditis elegans TaxID=6239 RepID=Q18712_CAEEL|nr:MFS domain-containing protein [Caenorhabditis elegans]CAA94126.2 MFS domain-containing protein [Caenorhabditis elegans]|eukprot:NP_510225.2 Gon-2 Extragenic Modifier [Caenorhabditis elegans]